MSDENHNVIFEKLGRIEGLLNGFDDKVSDFITRSDAAHGIAAGRVDEVEKRVRVLENDRAKAYGFMAAVSLAWTFAVQYFRDWVHR